VQSVLSVHVDAERLSRSRFAAIVRDVDPRLGWDGTQLTLQNAHDVALNPEPGVVLTPSLFLPRPAVWLGGPGQVMVGYPARAAARCGPNRPDGHAVRYERTEHTSALLAAIATTPGGDRPPDSATGRSSEPANQRRPS
jgi:hypothetical protein